MSSGCIAVVVLSLLPCSAVAPALTPAHVLPPSPQAALGSLVVLEDDPYQVLAALLMTYACFPPLVMQTNLVLLFVDLWMVTVTRSHACYPLSNCCGNCWLRRGLGHSFCAPFVVSLVSDSRVPDQCPVIPQSQPMRTSFGLIWRDGSQSIFRWSQHDHPERHQTGGHEHG